MLDGRCLVDRLQIEASVGDIIAIDGTRAAVRSILVGGAFHRLRILPSRVLVGIDHCMIGGPLERCRCRMSIVFRNRRSGIVSPTRGECNAHVQTAQD
ncbi:hypothetical protein WT25_11245 [Burkholderia territorii]|nr:hypothetical protein WT25_11245 [Burkholderia territorii]KWH08123.1 hypothetical protein WT59_23645 [Burkholderia territorii]